MKQRIDLQTWPRQDSLAFFETFKNPFISITVRVQIGTIRQRCHAQEIPFSSVYLYAVLRAVNQEEGLRYRITKAGEVDLYDQISALTIIRQASDNKLLTINVPYCEDFNTFNQRYLALRRNEQVPIFADESERIANDQNGVIMISPIPELNYIALTPAQEHERGSSFPLFSSGLITTDFNGQEGFPATLSVHHAFMDGYHVSQFFQHVEAHFASLLQ